MIAAVHGVAFGGGLQIIAGADIRIAHPAARFAVRELHWGIVPDMAGMALWRTAVRDDHLRELTYTAREFGAAEAERLGFVTRLADDPLAAALALAAEIAARNPHAIRAAKRLINAAADADAAALLRAESDEQTRNCCAPPIRWKRYAPTWPRARLPFRTKAPPSPAWPPPARRGSSAPTPPRRPPPPCDRRVRAAS